LRGAEGALQAAPASFTGRWPWELLALPALALAHALPETGAGLYARLAAATACLLVPGALVARALGRPSLFGALSWSLAGLALSGAVVFAVEGSLWLALGLYAAIGAVALPFSVARPRRRADREVRAVGVAVFAAGVGFGIALWHIAGSLDGDALFHLARVRKLEAFDALGLATVNEFADGGLHPGYAFPLWHLLLALVARLADVDPEAAMLHEPSVLVPLAFAVVYEAGVAVLRTAWAGVAAVLAQVGLTGLAAGGGGAYVLLALPSSASRHLLVPATVAAFFVFAAAPGWAAGATLAASSLALALVHPTYALFVAVPLAGYVAARALLGRREIARGLAGLACLLIPAAAVALWLLPVVRDTVSHSPTAEERARGLAHYAGQLDVLSLDRFRLAPEVLARAGPVAVAALLLVPLAAFAARRRWAALVLGGSVALLALLLIPEPFTRFSDAVSLSQSRRAAGFFPFAVAFAGGLAVLARLLSWLVLPVAVAAGIAFELVYPGDFGYRLDEGGPAIAAWVAFVGGAAALGLAAVLRRPEALDDRGPLAAAAAAAFVIPVAMYGFTHWDTAPADRSPLTAGVVEAVRAVPEGSVVFSDDETSYWLAAAAPVYVASALPGHVADTKENRPYARRADARRFGRTGNLAIPRRYRADYVLVRRDRWRLPRLPARRVYEDSRYVLYRL
jgi:hypothetical protein